MLELNHIGGRKLPVRTLEYTHPLFKKIISVTKEGGRNAGTLKPKGDKDPATQTGYDVDDSQSGSSSYLGAQVVGLGNGRRTFDNHVTVVKERKEVERQGEKKDGDRKKPRKPKDPRVIETTMGERASAAKLPPLEFKAISSASLASMGDLEALDETVRHMRDALPEVQFSMAWCH